MTMHSHPFGFTRNRAGRRQAARVRLSLPGKAVLISGQVPCRLDDLSQTGACLSLGGAAPPIGHDVVLMVQGVEAFGSVIWRNGSRFGVMFDEPLPRDEVVRLRAIHDHFQTLELEQNRLRARNFVQGRRFF